VNAAVMIRAVLFSVLAFGPTVGHSQPAVVDAPAGDVALVELFDYNCPYCRKAKGDIDALIKGDTRLRGVLKEFPVLGPDSVEASRVAVAAKLQLPPDKMRMFHDKLMETRGRASGDQAFALAKELGADVAKLQKDIQAGAISTVLHENAALADKLGITGTSTFILNEDIIAGAGGLEPAPSRREHATLRQSSVRVIEQAANAHSIGEPS